jgi:hypothetical protein
VRDAVAAHVGRDPFIVGAPKILSLRLARQGGVYVATLDIRDAVTAARIWSHPPISGADCRALLRTVGLSAAMRIDPSPQGAPAPEPPVHVPPPIMPSLPDRISPVPAVPAAHPQLRAGLGVAVQLGIAPAMAAGLSAQLGVRWRLISLSAEVRADLPASGDPSMPTAARTHLTAGSLVPCGHLALPAPLERWNLAGCGVLMLGAVSAELAGSPAMPGYQATTAPSATTLYVAAGPRASLEIHVGGPVALRVSGDVLGSIQPVAVRLTYTGGAHPGASRLVTTSPATGGIGGGVVVDL